MKRADTLLCGCDVDSGQHVVGKHLSPDPENPLHDVLVSVWTPQVKRRGESEPFQLLLCSALCSEFSKSGRLSPSSSMCASSRTAPSRIEKGALVALHAQLDVDHARNLVIRDVGSTFGTYLNDKRLSNSKRLSGAFKLKPADAILLASDLSKAGVSASLTKILVGFNNLGDEGTTILCDALRESKVTKVEELALRENETGPDLLTALHGVEQQLLKSCILENSLGSLRPNLFRPS